LSLAAASSTFFLFFSETAVPPAKTLETVAWETPANLATSSDVYIFLVNQISFKKAMRD
jgi:hypothetical protein